MSDPADAALLAEAIDAGFSGRAPLEESLAGYERRRNEVAFPAYEENCASASFLPTPSEVFERRAALRAASQAGSPVHAFGG